MMSTYARIPRHDMQTMLRFANVQYDRLICHRDHTFSIRRHYADGDEGVARRESHDRLTKYTKAVILHCTLERQEVGSPTGCVETKFAFEE